MTFQGVQDYLMGFTFMICAPFVPLAIDSWSQTLNIYEISDVFTLIIQFLSAILLAKRILKNKKDEE